MEKKKLMAQLQRAAACEHAEHMLLLLLLPGGGGEGDPCFWVLVLVLLLLQGEWLGPETQESLKKDTHTVLLALDQHVCVPLSPPPPPKTLALYWYCMSDKSYVGQYVGWVGFGVCSLLRVQEAMCLQEAKVSGWL